MTGIFGVNNGTLSVAEVATFAYNQQTGRVEAPMWGGDINMTKEKYYGNPEDFAEFRPGGIVEAGQIGSLPSPSTPGGPEAGPINSGNSSTRWRDAINDQMTRSAQATRVQGQ